MLAAPLGAAGATPTGPGSTAAPGKPPPGAAPLPDPAPAQPARPCRGRPAAAPRHGLRRPRSGTAQSSTISVDNPLHSPASSAPGLAPTRCAKKWRRIRKAYLHGTPLLDSLPARTTLAALPHHAPATTRPRPCRRAGVAATAIHAISSEVQDDIRSISNRDFSCGDGARSDSTAGTSCRRTRALGALSVAPEFDLVGLNDRTGPERSKNRRSSTARASAGLAWRLRSVTARACLRTLHNAPGIICSPPSGRRLPTGGPQIIGVMYLRPFGQVLRPARAAPALRRHASPARIRRRHSTVGKSEAPRKRSAARVARPAPFPACHGACEVTARSGQPHLTPLRSAPASAAPGPATPEAGRRPENIAAPPPAPCARPAAPALAGARGKSRAAPAPQLLARQVSRPAAQASSGLPPTPLGPRRGALGQRRAP